MTEIKFMLFVILINIVIHFCTEVKRDEELKTLIIKILEEKSQINEIN
jgi:hypothetical protein